MKNIVHVGASGEHGNDPNCTYHFFEPRWGVNRDDVKRIDNVNIYPFGISDYEGTAILNLTRRGQCSSLLEPNIKLIKKLQPSNWDRFEVTSRIEIPVNRLDNILPSDTIIDKLTIDTQGTELHVIKGAGDLLKNTQVIQCEVEFVELYINQPMYEDILDYVSKFGFKVHGFLRKVKWNETQPVFGDVIFKKA
jgi:FkbM family methyltransferase